MVSDCGAICDINRNHQVTANEAESAALAVNNGCILNLRRRLQVAEDRRAAGDDFRGDHHRQRGEAV